MSFTPASGPGVPRRASATSMPSRKNPKVRERGGQILKALRILQEVTGKPGLLARGYVKGMAR